MHINEILIGPPSLKIEYKIGKRRKSDIIVSISNPNKLIKFLNFKKAFSPQEYFKKEL